MWTSECFETTVAGTVDLIDSENTLVLSTWESHFPNWINSVASASHMGIFGGNLEDWFDLAWIWMEDLMLS